MTFSAYHDTLGEYHDIPDVLVEFKLLGIKVTLTFELTLHCYTNSISKKKAKHGNTVSIQA